MKTTLTQREINAILKARHSDPFKVLGMHEKNHHGKKIVIVRAFFPGVEQVFVYDIQKKKRYPMSRIHAAGVFEARFPRRGKRFPYQFETLDEQGHNTTHVCDPYAFPPVLSDDDLNLFRQGQHYTIYKHLGCHCMDFNGVSGACFAVWAPHATRVSVIGDFNGWDGRRHPMRLRKKAGVWELFIPGVQTGDRYEYEIRTPGGAVYKKSDPYGYHFEFRPKTASIVADIEQFTWTDQDWMMTRKDQNPLRCPISVYEVHLGSWKRKKKRGNPFLSYRELAKQLIPYVKEMGFTHIELLPVAEHPFDGSWGYQVTGYYAPTSRHGKPEDFMYFVNTCHQEGLGVIVDWVPSHFPKDAHSLSNFDGTCLYEYSDPKLGEHQDWGTLIFDYGKNEVRSFLLANAFFWFEKFHIDGIRVDAVSSMLYLDYSRNDGEWIPNKYGGRENLEAIRFLKELNTTLQECFPGTMTIAEESTSWLGVTYPTYLGGLEFTFKWNLGWMNDMLHYMSHEPVYRKSVHNLVSFALLYAFHERFLLELSHDEVVHGKGSLLAKMPGDEWQKFANLRALYGFMFGHPGKQLLFMGDEFGQWKEWDHDHSLAWELAQDAPHQELRMFVKDLNHLYVSEPALYQDDANERCFEWIDYHDYESSVFSFMRKTLGEHQQILIFVCNFTPVPRPAYLVGVPLPGHYREIINSDAESYGGSNVINANTCHAEATPWQGLPYSIHLTLPPLGVIILKPVEEKIEAAETEKTAVQKRSRISEHKRDSMLRELERAIAEKRESEVVEGQESERTVRGKLGANVADGPGIWLIEGRDPKEIEPLSKMKTQEESSRRGTAEQKRGAEQGQEHAKNRESDRELAISQRYQESQTARPQGSKNAMSRDDRTTKYRKSG